MEEKLDETIYQEITYSLVINLFTFTGSLLQAVMQYPLDDLGLTGVRSLHHTGILAGQISLIRKNK